MIDQNSQLLFASKRYRLHRVLGEGGMGIVYEALDRWNNDIVALKHVTTSLSPEPIGSHPSPSKDVDLALANEFRTLTSLRHPYIIHVLDYGFDVHRRPYFTMELLAKINTILNAALDLSIKDKSQLLIQTLQALAYLHHRGILHRDLKPENIAVTETKAVKLLDFGLATHRGSQSTSGTLMYMAPEILRDQPATEASDLYALGIIAYQLFAGHYPFDSTTTEGFLHATLHEQALDIPDISLSLNGVIQRLMSKDPENRYASANETIAVLTRAVGLPPPPETIEIRESFLQTAPLVGRASELVQLEDSLLDAVDGHGSGWLIGGESGVGKSRLVNEIRTRALTEGAVIITGQSVRETSRSYASWREPLRWLVLYSSLDDEEARFLKTLVPDIDALLERPVGDPPSLSAHQFEETLAVLITRLIQGIDTPVVLIFEDIQWMNNEGLALMSRISTPIAAQRCLLLATYRHDERSDLPSLLFSLHWMSLQRFTPETIVELATEILGQQGRDERLIDFLNQQTEGNAFFIIEIIRELAERSGTLDQVLSITLPRYVMTGGIREIMQRRLSRVSPLDRHFLSIAAVAGRELDLEVLSILNPSINLERWLERCQRQAILEFDGEVWRFAHDKIRENLLSWGPSPEARAAHQQVAQALEIVYGETNTHIAQMAFHWHAAGHDEKTAFYMSQVAFEAIRLYAYKQARTALHTALNAIKRLPSTRARIAQRIDLSLKLVTVSFTAATPQENLALLEEIQHLIEEQPEAQNPQQLVDIYYALGRVSYYYTQPEQALTYFRRMSLAAQDLGDSAQEIFATTMMGRVLTLQGFFTEAIALLDASDTLAQLERWTDWSMNQAYIGFSRVVAGDEMGFNILFKIIEQAQELNHASIQSIGTIFLAMSYWQAERYEDAILYTTRTIQITQASGDQQAMHLGYGFRAWSHSRMGNQDAAWVDFKEYERMVTNLGGRLSCADWFAAAKAELLFNTGYVSDAIKQAQYAVDMADAVGGVFASGIAHLIWARALSVQENTAWEDIEAHLRSSLELLIISDAHFEMERTRRIWDGLDPTSRDNF